MHHLSASESGSSRIHRGKTSSSRAVHCCDQLWGVVGNSATSPNHTAHLNTVDFSISLLNDWSAITDEIVDVGNFTDLAGTSVDLAAGRKEARETCLTSSLSH